MKYCLPFTQKSPPEAMISRGPGQAAWLRMSVKPSALTAETSFYIENIAAQFIFEVFQCGTLSNHLYSS